MWDVFNQLSVNLGVSFEDGILIVIILCGMIFYARDFKIGLLMQFLFSGLLWIWFYYMDLNYTKAMIVFFLTLVIMAFTFYAVSKETSTPIT